MPTVCELELVGCELSVSEMNPLYIPDKLLNLFSCLQDFIMFYNMGEEGHIEKQCVIT